MSSPLTLYEYSMCQICAIKDIAAKDRWPTPVEKSKPDLNILVEGVHDDYSSWQNVKKANGHERAPVPAALVDTVRALDAQLDILEAEREKWWTSPAKRALRQQLEADCDQRKLSDLHKINNTCTSSLEAISAKLGGFVKWSLGMNGGMWELKNFDKVAGLKALTSQSRSE